MHSKGLVLLIYLLELVVFLLLNCTRYTSLKMLTCLTRRESIPYEHVYPKLPAKSAQLSDLDCSL